MSITTSRPLRWEVEFGTSGHGTLTEWTNGEGYDLTIYLREVPTDPPREVQVSLTDDEAAVVQLLLARAHVAHLTGDR